MMVTATKSVFSTLPRVTQLIKTENELNASLEKFLWVGFLQILMKVRYFGLQHKAKQKKTEKKQNTEV